jgi:glycosyltransferase involved in cell wall biosynthesis
VAAQNSAAGGSKTLLSVREETSAADTERKRAAKPTGAQTRPDVSGLKVAYIMSRFPKLTETFVLYEMLALEQSGARVEIYPLLRERQSVTHPEAERLVRQARFQPFFSPGILYAQWHFFHRNPVRYLTLWWEVLRGAFGSLNFFVGALGIFPKAVRFAYEMERQGVAHVHAHFATHPTVAALIIHRLTDIPFSFTAHGSDLHVDRRMLDRKTDAAAFVVTVSSYNKEVMVRECGERARDKIHIIHCGVDLEVFVASRRERLEPRPLRIICVGSFEEVKGHRYLIEACSHLEKSGVDFQCDLVGDGPLRQRLQQQVLRACLADRIHFLGKLSRRRVVERLGEADVAVLASVPTPSGKREGIPVALMEAMASGLPVIASDLSGIPELVEHGRTGLLVAPGDSRGLAEALELLAGDQDLRTRMGLAGREKVALEFDLRRNAGILLQRMYEVQTSPRNRHGDKRNETRSARN